MLPVALCSAELGWGMAATCARFMPDPHGYPSCMANTDDLDEYDAELELRLKKEYADVFPIFQYCVVTDEATYLCNELAVDCVPHAAYLLFELDMRDVWVWDRNRPTRIIPRAHVFTTGDVTVEQLKGVEDELENALPSNVLDQLRAHLAADQESESDEESEAEAVDDEVLDDADRPLRPRRSQPETPESPEGSAPERTEGDSDLGA